MANLKGKYFFDYFFILYSTILAYELYIVLPRFPNGSITNFLSTFILNVDVISRLVFFSLVPLVLYVSFRIMASCFKEEENYDAEDIILPTLLALSPHILFHVPFLIAAISNKNYEYFQGRLIFIFLYILAVIVSYKISIKHQKK